jgi:recombination protein RecR
MDAFEKLVKVLRRLPGVGKRSAERMALRIVRDSGGLLDDLTSALKAAGSVLTACSRCGSLTGRDQDPCELCTGASRDGSLICVVEEPDDIAAIEGSGGYRGRYHALMGKLSPIKGKGPEDLRIRSLVKRIQDEGITEVVLALSTDIEGDSTAHFIAEVLEGKDVKVSRLAFGLPAGSGIRYSDPVTLTRAIKGRQGV